MAIRDTLRKKPRPASQGENLTAKCGHVVSFIPNRLDPTPEVRRQRILDRDCKSCRDKVHQASLAALREAKAVREAEKKQRKECRLLEPELKKKEKPRILKHGRLPHGSTFTDLVYDAERMMWAGKLTVPGFPTFQASYGSIGALLSILDLQYRNALVNREG